MRRSADMRYGEQIFEIPVDLDGIEWSRPTCCDRWRRPSTPATRNSIPTRSVTRRQYWSTHASPSIGELPALPTEPPRQPSAPCGPRSRRRGHLGEWREVSVFGFDDLAVGQIVEGPAIVESSTTTVLLRPGDRARSTPLGWLDVAVGER